MTQDFQPQQIVALEHDNRMLYGEVIQVVVSRQLCWVRPLILVELTDEKPKITDLRDASDLFWPINLFRPAFDTEVINFLCQILAKEPLPEKNSTAKKQLTQFVNDMWQASKKS